MKELHTKVLDHGYVKLVEAWGSDISIVQGARMSTDKGFLGWEAVQSYRCKNDGCKMPYSCSIQAEKKGPLGYACPNCGGNLTHVEEESHNGDAKLLRFLYKHKHMTPFEMAGMQIEVQAPIFVFREWHRHRTQSYNEMSGRYIQLPKMCYVPSMDRMLLGAQSSVNKQAGGEPLDADHADRARGMIEQNYNDAWLRYEKMLEKGVAKELARLVLPVNQYSRMRAQANLRCWLMFLELRDHKDAQWEIRCYAKAVAEFVEATFPRTYALYQEGRTDGK